MNDKQQFAYVLPERREVRIALNGETITIWQFSYEQDDSIIELSQHDAVLVANWLLQLAQEKPS